MKYFFDLRFLAYILMDKRAKIVVYRISLWVQIYSYDFVFSDKHVTEVVGPRIFSCLCAGIVYR